MSLTQDVVDPCTSVVYIVPRTGGSGVRRGVQGSCGGLGCGIATTLRVEIDVRYRAMRWDRGAYM